MPVHWYYNPNDIVKDYGEIKGYEPPRARHPSSIMSVSNTGGHGRGGQGGRIIGAQHARDQLNTAVLCWATLIRPGSAWSTVLCADMAAASPVNDEAVLIHDMNTFIRISTIHFAWRQLRHVGRGDALNCGQQRGFQRPAALLTAGDVINHGKHEFWGRPGVHYHQGMKAGDNTLNALCARLVLRSIAAGGGYDSSRFLADYVKVRLTDVLRCNATLTPREGAVRYASEALR